MKGTWKLCLVMLPYLVYLSSLTFVVETARDLVGGPDQIEGIYMTFEELQDYCRIIGL